MRSFRVSALAALATQAWATIASEAASDMTFFMTSVPIR
jgi:hypothetical protein